MRKQKEIQTETGKIIIRELKMKEILQLQNAFGGSTVELFGKLSEIFSIEKKDIDEFTFTDIDAIMSAFFEVNESFLKILEKVDMKEVALKFIQEVKKSLIKDFQNIQAVEVTQQEQPQMQIVEEPKQ